MLLLACIIAGHGQAAEPSACGPDIAGSPCGEEQVAGLPATGGVPQGVGNPVNLITGNKHQRETDMAALPGALGLELVRHYNSELARPGMPLYGIGRGWQFSYDTRLYPQGRTLQILQADGARRTFARSALSARLFASANPAEGAVRVARDDSELHYRWRWPDGRELGFDRNGRLRRILLPGGEALLIGRLADGRLASVTDPQGRSLTFHYLPQAGLRPSRLSAVRHVDTPVGRIFYDYGDTAPNGLRQQAENLLAVHLPTRHEPGKLRSLDGRSDRPADYSRSSLRRRYHYDDPRFPTLLTGISVTGAGSDGREIDQRIVRWAYDGNGLAVLSASGKAAQETATGRPPYASTSAGADLIMLDRRTPGRTMLTDGDGRVTLYRHAIVNGAFRLLEARGAGCKRCGPVNLRYGYDSLGRLQEVTRLDAQGVPVEGRREEHDAWGRVYASKTVQYIHGREATRTLVLRQLYQPAGIAAVLPTALPAAAQSASQHGPRQLAMASVLAGHDHKTVIEYNQRQQPLTVTETGYNPVDGSMQARTTRYRYVEMAGRSLLSEIDGPLPNGPAGTPADSDITRYEWDAQGAYLRRIYHPMGAISDMEYDPHSGRLTVLTLRWERTVRQLRHAYDPLGQLEQVVERTLDVDGVTLLAERALGIRWNALGRPSALVEADGTVRELDDAGQAGAAAMALTATAPAMPGHALAAALASKTSGLVTSGMPASASRTGVAVTAAGALWPTQYGDPLTAAAHEALRFDANGRTAERRIDDFGQVVAIRNPGQGWQHARYDEAGRLVEIRDPRGARTLARYDAAGRLLGVERTMPGESPEQLAVAWRGPARLSETVTVAGRQTHATHYRHTPWGQVSQMQVDIAGIDGGAPVRMSLQSRYDTAGRLVSRTLPGGERLAWRYYANAPYRGQQAAIEQIHWPVWLDGLMTRLPEAWLDRWRWKTRIAVFTPQEGDRGTAMALGASGATSASEASAAAALATYAASFTTPAAAAAPTGSSREAPQVEPGLSTQAPGADHDAAGLPHRLSASAEALTLRWNAAGQLSEVRKTLGAGRAELQTVARYRYDARGRRASKHAASGDEYYLYEGTQLVAAVSINPQGRRSLNQFLYEGYRAVAWLRDGVAHALQTDSRGALSEVRTLADDGKPAQTLWRAQLDAWGNRPAGEPPSPYDPKLRLVNQYADDETGLSYHIARYYDPSQGRFLSPDPAGIADTLAADVPPVLRLEMTAYVAGQPWHYIDPDGAARLIYYALTTDAKGKQLGTSQGFTRARWAFSIDGIEASGDGGSDAINQLMEKYAKNQTGLLFDGGGDYLTGGKKAVSWNGAADETVDGFRKHYGKNLIGLANFTIGNFSNRDAALLVAGLMKETGEIKGCPLPSALLPPINFQKEEVPIKVSELTYSSEDNASMILANRQRIVMCGSKAGADPDIRRIKKYNYAAMLLESFPSQINIDCSKNNGCPGRSLKNTVLPNYVASYGPTQFILSTMLANLKKMQGDRSLGAETRAALRLDDATLWNNGPANQASLIDRNMNRAQYVMNQFLVRSSESPDWEKAGEDEKHRFISNSGFSDADAMQVWNDMNLWKRNPAPNLSGEAAAAFYSKVIMSDSVLKEYLMEIIMDSKPSGAFNLMSEYFLKENYETVKKALNIKNDFPEFLDDKKINPKWIARQREVEIEYALRVARLHNGDLCAEATKSCKRNVAVSGTISQLIEADSRSQGRSYATRFVNAKEYPYIPKDGEVLQPVGDYFSLRCTESFDLRSVERGGLEMIKLSI